MLNSSDLWPPAGIQVVRRSSPAGRVDLPEIADHRVSLHLSKRTLTTCWESGLSFMRLRGDIDLTPAQSIGGFDADERSDSLEVRVPIGFLQRVADEMHVCGARTAVETRHLLQEEGLTHLVLAIDAEHSAGSPGGRLYMDSLGVALAVQLLARHTGPLKPTREGLSALQIQRIVDFIEAHLDTPLSLSQLADVAGVSRSYLQREFKSKRGTSIHQYVVSRRVEKARVLLLNRSLPASEVALAAGFSHQSHMARWMRRLLGVTPGNI
ncbi:helix-turn-helix transcriptional regulator [Dyella tabacisoli]|uniref:AraC family transcriptional regulator n=1 Tax=Dyella tabacisoli TaxID=2282381 RepID=A0A369ULL8_9GAMM|nr:AraC family transcriptional regulator [Dyella tabacisoli]RDD81476.1 AraC family transcriptional regulator [Dyella tabacisoli]